MLNQKQITEIFNRFKEHSPNPKTELESVNNFSLLVAIILSAQATDISVNKATKSLFLKYDSPEKLLSLGEEGLKQYIKSIGLFNSKAKNIIKLCQILVNNPIIETIEELEKLPGVGSKTARVYLNCALGLPHIAVDTHVFRVSNRLGLLNSKNPKETEKLLPSIIPIQFHQHAHHWLILHGRYICKAIKPKCSECYLNDICEYYKKTIDQKI